MQLQSLADRVALVTGAGSGLGEATAVALAEAGCRVACLDVRGEAAERTRHRLGGNHDHLAIACDVGDEGQVAAAIAQIAETCRRLDFAISCAAIDHTYSVEEMSIEQWDQVIRVNLRGPFLIARAAMPQMRRNGGGHIVNVASTAATRAWANAAAYHASKWGLVGFSRGLGVEGRPHNIRVSTIFPGGMRTHFFDRFEEQGIPMPDERNLQAPATVAEAIVFMLSTPGNSVIQELMITPLSETSWP
ncbi:MAG: SDR family oxidoreductase [Oscillochloris sp.]|nr:SDR family oxidoreductase [Oscillochloris sp.]